MIKTQLFTVNKGYACAGQNNELLNITEYSSFSYVTNLGRAGETVECLIFSLV